MNYKFSILFILLFLVSCGSASYREYKSSAPYESKPYNPYPGAMGGAENSDGKQAKEKSITKRYIIYNVDVNVQAKNLEEKVTDVIKLAESFQGYALQYSSGGTVTLKVPAENMKPFLEKLRNTSENYYEEIKASDVTEEYLDTELRLDTAKKMRTRLLEILKQAKNLEEIMKVEAELSKVSENIERIEGRLKFLASNVEYSTITVKVLRKYEPYKEKEYKPGPLGYPFYYAYIGLGKLVDGIVWLFVQSE